jgi:ubiquinone/menaquinone biosynthesis C-methylase UbiE
MSFDDVLKGLPVKRDSARTLLSRLAFLTPEPSETAILEIGAAQGEFVMASRELGYHCIGLEPFPTALDTARKVSDYLGVQIEIVDGVAEAMPFEVDSFDLVTAASVIEHVKDVEKVFYEVGRVLKPGGVFWFHTASSMCPKQDEIRRFPLFGWYPDPLKQKIMNWAKENRPDLIGYTDTPAVHWFTPRKARRLLLKTGFREVYDRWDLLASDVNMKRYKFLLKAISSSRLLKYVADVVRTGCSYAAVKW